MNLISVFNDLFKKTTLSEFLKEIEQNCQSQMIKSKTR